MSEQDYFAEVFARLKAILKPYAPKCDVLQDTNEHYYLNTRHVMKNKQPLFFAGVRTGKAYVSFYLMPAYASPELLKSMSAELKRRMQGKSCFNFKRVDEKLFKELTRLTKAGFARFQDKKFLGALLAAQNRRG
jgi:hypothetical protein